MHPAGVPQDLRLASRALCTHRLPCKDVYINLLDEEQGVRVRAVRQIISVEDASSQSQEDALDEQDLQVPNVREDLLDQATPSYP